MSRLALLTAGSFTVGASAYLIAGVLPAISDDLSVSAAAVGQLVTVFAIAYAIASPLLTTAASDWERRRLLFVALGLGVLGNGLAALVPVYEVLLVARVLTALGGAIFLPVATGVATAMVTPERRGRAVSAVYGGLALALILWVPLAAVLSGGPVGYRGVFAIIAGMAALAAVGVRFGLPAVDAPPAVPLRARVAAIADPRVRLILLVTLVGALSAFGVFTYIAPLLKETGGFTVNTVGVLLLFYGLGSAVGTVLGGSLSDRYGPRMPLVVLFAVYTVVLATLSLTTVNVVTAAAALFVWGTVTWAVNPPTQSWLLELAPSPAAGPLLLSANTSALYLGIGLSGVFGGVVSATAGITALPPISAVVGAIGLLLLLFAGRTETVAVRPAEAG